MSRPSSGNGEHDIASDIEHTSKRQRTKAPLDDNVSQDTDYSSDETVQGSSENQLLNENGNDNKPKSRHRIHVPQKADLPEDTFMTQVSARSSSPYRIDDFHWHKPVVSRAGAETTSPRNKAAAASAAHSWTAEQVEGSALSGENIANGASNSNQAEHDEFDCDDGYEEILTSIPQETLPYQGGSHLPQDSTADSITSAQPSPRAASISKVAAPLSNLKQTTLFGTQAETSHSSQPIRRRNWPVANRDEPPTHHEIDRGAMKTWVYPINLGTIRNYQYSIVAAGLYHNLLVALPTGLGKTFIAATVMLNWFRWTKDAQLVFVAPTKPLVSQQVKACFEIAGIPRSTTTLLTGSTVPGLRAEEWRSKRVFFMTPQTLINDLKTGICDPKRLVLIVIDEAHRATGSYAYVEVVNFVKRFNSSFRILALTATPGASIESVQEVINGLGISRIEIRTEDSIDIREYVHSRKIETVRFDTSEEMSMILDLFSKALQPAVDHLVGLNAYWSRDPLSLTPYGCTQARQRWFASDAGRNANHGLKAMVMNTFSLLASLSHATELLKFHGIGPFYHKVLAFRNEIHAGGKKGGKQANQINTSEPFQTLMSRVQIWINSSDFVGHPKLQYVQEVVLNHFLDAGEGRGARDPSATRIMVFAHYRSSAEEIVRILRRNEPMIRSHVFVGQSSVKDSEGMDQKTQLEIIRKFQNGTYNTLVATSIGEEGLDIGEVDLIICYDASASPIRMLQRMGRTGRKRAGNIVVTLMNGKEADNFSRAKDNYEKIQQEISSGARFEYYEKTVRRIVPRDIQPVVDKKFIDIPLENTQADLPEPTKRGRPPKRPPKKFHMPDGVRTGFVKASHFNANSDDSQTVRGRRRRGHKSLRSPSPVELPSLQDVLLNSQDQDHFERQYLDIAGDSSEVVRMPAFDAATEHQRTLRPCKNIGHSQKSRRLVAASMAIHNTTRESSNDFQQHLRKSDREDIDRHATSRANRLANVGHGLQSPFVGSVKPSENGGAPSLKDMVSFENLQATWNTEDGSGVTGRRKVRATQSDDELPDINKIVHGGVDGPQDRRVRRGVARVVSDDSDEA